MEQRVAPLLGMIGAPLGKSQKKKKQKKQKKRKKKWKKEKKKKKKDEEEEEKRKKEKKKGWEEEDDTKKEIENMVIRLPPFTGSVSLFTSTPETFSTPTISGRDSSPAI